MRLLPLAVLLAACARSTPPAPAAAVDDAAPIKLTFAWAPGWQGTWTTSHRRTQTGDGTDQVRTQEASGTMRTEGSAGGLVTSSTTSALDLMWTMGGEPAPQLDLVKRFTEPLVGLTTRTLVLPDGGYAGLLDANELAETLDVAMQAALGPLLATLPPEAAEGLAQMAAGSTVVTQVEDAARQRWWNTVELWAGRDLTPGQTTPVTFDTTDLLDDATVTIALTRTLPCHDGADAPRCVELVTTLTQPGATLADQVRASLPAGMATAMQMQVVSVTDVTTTTTRAEPDTLRTWGSSSHNERVLTLMVQGTEQRTLTTEDKTLTMAWD